MTSSLPHQEPQQSEAFTAMVRCHAEKFLERHKLLETQLSEATLKACLRQRKSEERRGIALRYWSFEGGIADAFASAKLLKKHLASLGGRSKGPDSLQVLIEELVRRKPTISKAQLLRELKRSTHEEVIVEVEDDVDLDGKAGLIRFMDRGREKTAKISSVQHRLTRARKTRQQRKILDLQ